MIGWPVLYTMDSAAPTVNNTQTTQCQPNYQSTATNLDSLTLVVNGVELRDDNAINAVWLTTVRVVCKRLQHSCYSQTTTAELVSYSRNTYPIKHRQLVDTIISNQCLSNKENKVRLVVRH